MTEIDWILYNNKNIGDIQGVPEVAYNLSFDKITMNINFIDYNHRRPNRLLVTLRHALILLQ